MKTLFRLLLFICLSTLLSSSVHSMILTESKDVTVQDHKIVIKTLNDLINLVADRSFDKDFCYTQETKDVKKAVTKEELASMLEVLNRFIKHDTVDHKIPYAL